MAQARRIPESAASAPLSPRLKSLWRETLLFLLSAIAIYVFLSLATWTSTDPNWMHTSTPERISNLGGSMGAGLSNVLLGGFGYMAYLFPVLIGLLAWRIYRHGSSIQSSSSRAFAMTTAGFLFALIGGSGLSHLHFHGMAEAMPIGTGGVLGNVLGNIVSKSLGMVGGTLLLLAVFLAGLTWFGRFSWLSVMDIIGKSLFDGWDWLVTQYHWLRDDLIGRRARRVRQEQVIQKHKLIEKRKPPVIEPKIVRPVESERREREKQSTLFEDRVPTGKLPPIGLLDAPKPHGRGYTEETLNSMSRLLESKLGDFNIQAQVIEVQEGPVITRFEIEPSPGTKSSQVVNVQRDLARALSLISVRVVENIPGKSLIGIEIPNEYRETVSFVEGISSKEYEDMTSPLAIVLGKDISGEPMVGDLSKMPHLLIAGTTGSGKSVCINALILSLLYKSTPDQVRLIMIDPKMLELSIYEGIPHLLSPVVTDMQQASNALRWCIVEMERRYKIMSELGVRNVSGYNRKIKAGKDAGKPLLDPTVPPEEEGRELQEFAYIVVLIDELADLMMVVGKKVEELITRIAQRARAAGIHLILATQRPSVDVITGLLKANVPSRIAFQVSSRVDSRTVLDQMGAEQLLGNGDMLYLPVGAAVPVRVHGSFVSDEEVHEVVEHLKKSGSPEYDTSILEGVDDSPGAGSAVEVDPSGESDPLYDQSVAFVTETRRASISAVQRRLRIGYNRAARMVETMEAAGIVGPLQSNGKREVLVAAPPES